MTACLSVRHGHAAGLRVLGPGRARPGAVLRPQVLPQHRGVQHADRGRHRGQAQGGAGE